MLRGSCMLLNTQVHLKSNLASTCQCSCHSPRHDPYPTPSNPLQRGRSLEELWKLSEKSRIQKIQINVQRNLLNFVQSQISMIYIVSTMYQVNILSFGMSLLFHLYLAAWWPVILYIPLWIPSIPTLYVHSFLLKSFITCVPFSARAIS